MSTKIERFVIRHTAGSKINQVEEFDFNTAELKIGRAAGSEIQFDPEKEVIVSREHGSITKVSEEPPAFAITDNNSRNGIFVNKTRVKGTVPLNPGDEVQLGNNGPVFTFDIYPRPKDLMMATRVIEIPSAIKPTTVSEVQQVTVFPPSEPVKTGLGKQTVERMLVAERKKSYKGMGALLAVVVVALGILGYTFRDKIFGQKTVITEKAIPYKDTSGIIQPDQISRENEDRVVQIEFGWMLFDAATNDELWQAFGPVAGQTRALYIRNSEGQIEPYLDTKKNINQGAPIGMAGATGSGFVVSGDGFILTNRHVAASWNTRYGFPQWAFPGGLVEVVNGKLAVNQEYQVQPEEVFGWVPSEAKMVGGRPIQPGMVKGRNTYLNVIFANTSLRRPVQSVTPSDNHDVALIKVEIPENLSEVKMVDNYNDIKPGQAVTVMGYPGVAPQQFVVRKSNDPFNPANQFTSIPTPTVTPGNIGRIIHGSSDKDMTYSTMGDSYQLTINATGGGNSGGPMFDNKGNVIGIYYAGASDARGTQISFAIPIKYGLELMGRKKIADR
ncbi:MAG: FHA domain-containing protein [Chitinophagaceae bacterium]|nr:MAG: FHA domain-containing protein [Chitinophagaceae bacterium]